MIKARAFRLAVPQIFMNTHIITQPRWSTASFGDSAKTSPMELAALGAHLTLCKEPHGRLIAMQCVAYALHAFVAPRFITTLVVMTLLMVVTSLVL